MPDYIYNLYEAKTRLPHLIDRAAKGEEILIAKAGGTACQTRSAAKVQNPKQTRWMGGKGPHIERF